MGPWLSERLGQRLVVENQPGGGGNIGTEAVVRASPDGYTLLLVDPSGPINATLYEKLNFVFLRDIAPIASVIRFPYVVVVHPSVPTKTIPELVAYRLPRLGVVHHSRIGRPTSAQGQGTKPLAR